MKNRTCIIADDEPLARELLAVHISKIPNLDIVAACPNAIETKFALEKYRPDLLFLDIQMPDLSGLELLRMLKNRPPTILTTAFSEHALEGYELDVIDYLLKPIEFERFFKAVSKALDRLGREASTDLPTGQIVPPPEPLDDFFFVKSDHKIIKVQFADILFIEALQKYVRIHTTRQRVVTQMSMSQLEAMLPSSQFFRIHRSSIINLGKIDSIEGSTVRLDKHNLAISKGQREAFLDWIGKKGKGF